MKLSIIVPIYKVEDYIVRCMNGILHQDLEDYEVIAVDDGSPDRSIDILQEYLQKHPTEATRVRIVRKENGGLSDARNAGMAVAKGDYLWFVDSDDTIAENCLGMLYDAVSADDLDLLMFDEQNMEEQNDQYRERTEDYRNGKLHETVQSGIDLFIELRERRAFYSFAQGYWIRRSVLEECGLQFLKGIHHEDELFTPQALHYAARARYMPVNPYIRYVREGSITTSESIDRMIEGYGAVITGILSFSVDVVQREDERKWLQEDMVSLAQITLGEASKHRDLSAASKDMLRTIREDLRAHHLSLGLPFTLYTLKNRFL